MLPKVGGREAEVAVGKVIQRKERLEIKKRKGERKN